VKSKKRKAELNAIMPSWADWGMSPSLGDLDTVSKNLSFTEDQDVESSTANKQEWSGQDESMKNYNVMKNDSKSMNNINCYTPTLLTNHLWSQRDQVNN
jgi:hypothetical protein